MTAENNSKRRVSFRPDPDVQELLNLIHASDGEMTEIINEAIRVQGPKVIEETAEKMIEAGKKLKKGVSSRTH